MTLVHANDLTAIATKVLLAAGTPRAGAEVVAASLVESDLVGHDSHGVRRLPSYLEMVRAGRIDPAARPQLGGVRAAAAVVDGRSGFGQLAARTAVDHVRRLARQYGVASVAINNCEHVGRLGEYVQLLANDETVGLALGGRGTNPLALAAPRAPGRPALVVDFAAPEAGHGLGVLIELIGGLLSGAGVSGLTTREDSNGTVIVAMEIAAFRPVAEFRQRAEEFCALLSAGAGPIPGEIESATRMTRVREGVPVPDDIWADLASRPGGPAHRPARP
ncbi:Ldh family oxidoreductase [Phytohabitans rumicis]|uniref:Dehydrogenase n=1 Tax=Phytohabitans rumicis TaxID=1076125 RepID=A0A6V8LC23_9ACTN|nr:Ldh family oxidoreductase [Phytohabitans rumicis]GFJ90225.1 hypothetical protein Prum_038670 [Phytohabitans rumicis]